jgi:hypothetical protein
MNLVERAARGGVDGVPPMPERAADLFGETGWVRLLIPAASGAEAGTDLEERLAKAEDAWNRQVLDLLHRLTRMEAAAADLNEADPSHEVYRSVLRAEIEVLERQVRAFSRRDARGFLVEAGLLDDPELAPGTGLAAATGPADGSGPEASPRLVDLLVARIADWAGDSDGAAAGWQVTAPDAGQGPGVRLRRTGGVDAASPAEPVEVAVYLDEYDKHAGLGMNRIASDAAERAALRAAGVVVFQLTADDLAELAAGGAPASTAPYEDDAQAAARNGYRVLGGDLAELDDLIWRGGARTLRAFLADPSPDRWRRFATAALAGLLVRPGGWRMGLDDDNFPGLVRAALLAEPLPASVGEARTLVRVLDGRGCRMTVIIDQRVPGPRAPLGWWTGLAVLDDRLPVVRSSEAAHRGRWTSWLHWGNLLQFLAGPDGDGLQLAHSRLDELDPRTLAAAAPAPPASDAGFVRARAGLASPASLAPLFAAEGPSAGTFPDGALSPPQRAIAERSYDGPALVTGGPGTGKTTVALYRAWYLAQRPAGAGSAPEDPRVPSGPPSVLFATFNKHLAGIARQRLLALGGSAVADRVEVVTIDALAARVAVPQGGEAWRSVLREAVRREAAQAAERGPRYRHVVADEAQDLTAEHLMLLRAMVAPGPDDLFLAGDPGQRIYGDDGSPASLEILARLGIDVGDRATELAASYRLPPEPERRGVGSWLDELEGIARQVTDWLARGRAGGGDKDGVSVGVALPDLPLVTEVVNYLDRQGIVVSAIGIDGPRVPDSVHVGTLRRFKGLEYDRMLLAGLTVSAPLTAPLLHMAATRARESLVISWHGPPSGLLGE